MRKCTLLEILHNVLYNVKQVMALFAQKIAN